MFRLIPRLMLVAGVGLAATACQGDSYPPPSGYYQPTPAGYNNPYYNNANYNNPYYNQQNRGWYNQGDGRRYTTVTVTNRGQNGYRDDVVQQQVVCGSQYYDGYRTRTARC